jgi:hypothetical protein
MLEKLQVDLSFYNHNGIYLIFEKCSDGSYLMWLFETEIYLLANPNNILCTSRKAGDRQPKYHALYFKCWWQPPPQLIYFALQVGLATTNPNNMYSVLQVGLATTNPNNMYSVLQVGLATTNPNNMYSVLQVGLATAHP